MKLMLSLSREQRKFKLFASIQFALMRNDTMDSLLISPHSFSGMAYTWSERLDQIAVLTNIDSSNKEYEKVPTAIEFVKNGVTIRPNWGNFAQHAPGSLKWFKLLLLNDEDLRAEVRNSEHIRAARARLEEFDMTVTEVIGRYLKELWEGALVLIKADASQATVANSRFHVVVTLPAICQSSYLAKQA